MPHFQSLLILVVVFLLSYVYTFQDSLKRLYQGVIHIGTPATGFCVGSDRSKLAAQALSTSFEELDTEVPTVLSSLQGATSVTASANPFCPLDDALFAPHWTTTGTKSTVASHTKETRGIKRLFQATNPAWSCITTTVTMPITTSPQSTAFAQYTVNQETRLARAGHSRVHDLHGSNETDMRRTSTWLVDGPNGFIVARLAEALALGKG